MTSNAIEFIRSARLSVTSATLGRGWSTRTKLFCSVTDCTLSRGPWGQRKRLRGRIGSLVPLAVVLGGDRGVDVELFDLLHEILEVRRPQRARLVEHQLA